MNKEEYNLFKEKYCSHELKERIYNNHNFELLILSTLFEYSESCLYWFDNVFPVDTFDKINIDDIKILKDKYINLLKKMGLTTLIALDSDPDIQSSYYEDVECDDNGTVFIKPSKNHKDIMYDMDLAPKEVNVFIFIFGSLFKKNNQ